MKKAGHAIVIALLCLLVMTMMPFSSHDASASMAESEFISMVANLAVADYPNSHILPSVVIAQAALETGYGKSQLMMNNNALFGVKANSSWTGGFYSATTKEHYDQWTTVTALFRAYPSFEACIQDHARILSLSRYNGVVGGTDYVTVCNLLQSGGYATDPNYASKLINIIQSRELYKYDTGYIPPDNKYNASAAVTYARNWSVTDVIKRNPSYTSYAGADCANFVSQCLFAGGLSTDSSWHKDSNTWIQADTLRRYLVNRGYSGTDYSNNGGSKIDVSTLSPGDIVWCTGASGIYGHVMIVSSVTSTDYYICGHTKERCDYRYTNNKITYHVKMNGTIPIPIPPTPIPPEPDPTHDYIVHIDHPTGTYDGAGGVEISGWIASKIQLTSCMVQSPAIEGGQMNLTSGLSDATDELDAAGYGDYTYKCRFRGVIPSSGLTPDTSYSFSIWMDLINGGQTKVTTSSFRVGSMSGNTNPAPAPLDCIVHIDAPTGSYTDTDVEISGWIASMKQIGSCMVESEAIPMRQENLTGTLTDASAELDGAGYSQYPYKYRFNGAIPKYGMKSDTDYELKVWFNFSDGSSSGVTTSTFHTNDMKNTKIVISNPKGGSNYANNSNLTIDGYILANSPLWYILGSVGDNQYSFEGTNDANLAANNGYAYAYRYSKTIRCDDIPDNSNPTLTIWTKTSADGVETYKSVAFTTGARVYGSLSDYRSTLDNPSNGIRISKDTEVTGWIAAHAPIAYVFYQGVPTDGSDGFQILCGIEPTSELDSNYSGYEYRARFRGIIEYGSLKSNKTYNVTVWCGLVDSNGEGQPKQIDGCGRTFTTGTVTKPVYTNTFNANGGTGAPEAVQKTWGTAITLPTQSPMKLGSTFIGWSFRQDAFEAKYVPGASFTEETSHKLYAVYEKPHLIAVDTTLVENDVDVTFAGQKICFSLTPAENTAYRFTGTDGAEFTVYDDEGTICGSGASVETNLIADKTYYIYAGLANASNTGSFTMTVARGYQITFDANGGTGAPAGLYYQYHDESLEIPDLEPSREVVLSLDPVGGTLATSTRTLQTSFLGWSADEGVIEESVFNMPVVLEAEWDTPVVRELETPVKEGYVFCYWVDDEGTVVDDNYVAKKDTTLTAVWQLKQYTASYNLNGCEGEIRSTNKLHGRDTIFTTEEPLWERHIFVGWALTANATEARYMPGDAYTMDANITLYAVWVPEGIPVTGFVLTENDFSVPVGGTYQINLVLEPEGADISYITWEILKSSIAIATVDENGLVTAVSPGTAMIKIRCEAIDKTVYARATVTPRSMITLPEELTRIEDEAFMGDTSITEIHLGTHVSAIGDSAFKNCSNLLDIWIPETTTNIALNAFIGCDKLTIHCAEKSVAWEVALLSNINFVIE